MEHIDAFFDIWEALLGEKNKAAVHIKGEEADVAALFWRVVPEIDGQVFKIHAWKDVDNVTNGTIGVIAVETAGISTHGILVINLGRTHKFVNAESMR